MLVSVCSLLNDIEPKQDVVMDAEQDVKGNRVSTTGHFEFVISREKKICIVEVKRELFDKGTAQSLTGCEAVADVDDLNLVYSIVTNYENWHFIKAEDQFISREIVYLEKDKDGCPTRAFVKMIAEKIHAMLLHHGENNVIEREKSKDAKRNL